MATYRKGMQLVIEDEIYEVIGKDGGIITWVHLRRESDDYVIAKTEDELDELSVKVYKPTKTERNILAREILPATADSCMRCGRHLENPVSQFMAIGPICAGYWLRGLERAELESYLEMEIEELERDPETIKRIAEIREQVEVRAKQVGGLNFLDVDFLSENDLTVKGNPKIGILVCEFKYGCDRFEAIKSTVGYDGLRFRWFNEKGFKFWYTVDPTADFLYEVKRTLELFADILDLSLEVELPNSSPRPASTPRQARKSYDCSVRPIEGQDEYSIELRKGCRNFEKVKNHIKNEAYGWWNKYGDYKWVIRAYNIGVAAEGIIEYGISCHPDTAKLLESFIAPTPEPTRRTARRRFNNLKSQAQQAGLI